MIAGIFHEGSGLGNQLFRYVATRVVAKGKKVSFCMVGGPFKGQSFMDLDLGMGVPSWFENESKRWNEKKIVENGIDIRSYDPEINFVQDNTIIDGEFQDPRYFEHRMDDVAEWLQVEPLEVSEGLCVIGFRGGEYYAVPELGLPPSYFDSAITEMRKINPRMRFEVHTDDVKMALAFFPDFPIVENPKLSHSVNENMGYNWRSMRYAKYAIVANSSFYILPRLIKHHENKNTVTIAPRYWARHEKKVWALPQNYYSQFTYI